jgi:signal transduction protein with GAF and PtsI domain
MGSIEQIRKRADVSLAQLEADITGVRSGDSLSSIALPDHVEHQQDVTRATALSAEAVVRDYEMTAREIESMGAELIDAAKKCEAMTAEVHNAIADMRDTAAAYREEGKKVFKRIQASALFTQDVRKSCEEVKRRMVAAHDNN